MSDRDLTQGPVWRALTAVSAPMAFGILAVLSVGLADAYFLGQLGPDPLAAVGFIYPVITAITSLSIGLSAGANAIISQRIGAKSDSADAARRVALHALLLGTALSIAVALAFWLMAEPLFRLMGAGEGTLQEALSYAPFWALSFPFLVGQMMVNAVFRAHGNGAASAFIMVLAAAFGIGLNPVLIFGWGPVEQLGTAGAAIATAIGRVIALGAALFLAVRWGFLSLRCQPFKDWRTSAREVTKIGAPAALSNAINPAGMALITAAVAQVGDLAVAGFGAAARIQSVVFVPMLSLSAGIGPVVGQNWGAEKPDRAQAAVAWAWRLCALYGLGAAVLLSFFAAPLAALFANGDAEVAGYTESYLRIVSWSFAGYGILVTSNAAMNGRSKAGYALMLSLTRIAVIYVPLAWAGLWAFGYTGILCAAVLANVFAIGGALWCLSRCGITPFGRSSRETVQGVKGKVQPG